IHHVAHKEAIDDRLRYLGNRMWRHGDVIFFFFSSRRRHTRLQGDWSSDVCSSDLATTRPTTPACWRSWSRCPTSAAPLITFAPRSEERRVGKECRSRWWPEH